MSGARTKCDYVSEDGNTYSAAVPTWLYNLYTAPTSASTTPLPRGFRRRVRYHKTTATGRLRKMPVWSAADPLYTSGFGTASTIMAGAITGATGFVGTLTGRTGERDKDIAGS